MRALSVLIHIIHITLELSILNSTLILLMLIQAHTRTCTRNIASEKDKAPCVSCVRVLLHAYKFAQDASARRMPDCAHGNKSGAYWFWAIQSVSPSAASLGCYYGNIEDAAAAFLARFAAEGVDFRFRERPPRPAGCFAASRGFSDSRPWDRHIDMQINKGIGRWRERKDREALQQLAIIFDSIQLKQLLRRLLSARYAREKWFGEFIRFFFRTIIRFCACISLHSEICKK